MLSLKKHIKIKVTLLLVFLLLPLSYAQAIEPCISANDLHKILNNEDTKVLDVRSKFDYLKGHIPGAIQIHTESYTSPPPAVAHTIASKDQLENSLKSHGISPGDYIILYSDSFNQHPARLAWLMKAFGLEKTSLLDGGIEAWEKAGFAVSDSELALKPSDIKLDDINTLIIANSADVLAAIKNDKTIILDSRSEAEYSGEYIMDEKAGIGGRIPTAININWLDFLDDKNEYFLSKDQILSLLASKNIDINKTIIVYCQANVRASFTAFVLQRIAGAKNVKVYLGSWYDWIRKDMPIENKTLAEKREVVSY